MTKSWTVAFFPVLFYGFSFLSVNGEAWWPQKGGKYFLSPWALHPTLPPPKSFLFPQMNVRLGSCFSPWGPLIAFSVIHLTVRKKNPKYVKCHVDWNLLCFFSMWGLHFYIAQLAQTQILLWDLYTLHTLVYEFLWI